MKITLINESFPPVIDGVANVVMNYGRVLSETAGDEVVLATPSYPEGVYTGYPYTVIPYRSAGVEKLTGGYRAGDPFDGKTLRYLTEFRPDIIHAHSPATALFMARILRYTSDAPLIYTYHTKYDIDIARAVKSRHLQKESIKLLVENISACDEVWAVSRGAADNLRSLGFEGLIRVVSNGVDFPRGTASEEAVREAASVLDLPENIPVYLYVGRMMTYKGLPIILDALRILREKGEDFRMLFVGGGDDRPLLEDTAVSYGFTVLSRAADGTMRTLSSDGTGSAVVCFLGPVRERETLRALNTRADLFLFPSTFDTNGLVVREAAACALASVLIAGSCAAEGVEDGRNGFLIGESAESMAALLSELGKNPQKMRDAGRHAMDELYLSWESAVSAARELYAEVLEKKQWGLYDGRKPAAGDYFFETAAEVTVASADEFAYRQQMYEGMLENAAEVRERIETKSRQIRSEIREAELSGKKTISEMWSDLKKELGF